MPDPREHASTEQLADLLEGELPDSEAEPMVTHLHTCAECAAVRDRLQALPALLATTPVSPMPAHLAARLEEALAAEADRRSESASPDTVVVPLRRLRRDRVRHLLTGAVAAAAALVAVSVAGDLVLDLGGEGEGSSTSADQAAEAGAGEDLGQPAARGPTGNAAEQRALPDVHSATFARDVELLYASGAAAFPSTAAPLGGRKAADAVGQQFAATTGCTAPTLRSGGVRGSLGSLVLLDGRVARLVASGPAADREVAAYSCATGDRLAAAVVDLRR